MSDRARAAGAIALATLATPARAECFNCYDDLGWLLLVALAGILLMLWGLWWIIRSGRSWVFKWVVLAVLLYLAVSWVRGQGWQMWQTARIEAREKAGPLPVMAERRPLVLYGGTLSGRFASGCSVAFDLFRKSRAAQGFHGIALSALAGRDLTQPLPLAELPISFHWIEADPAAPAPGDAPVAFPTSEDEARDLLWDLAATSDMANDRFQSRSLTVEERQAVAARVDYLIIDPCSAVTSLDHQLRMNPALAGLPRDVEVRLAMAPVDPAQPGPIIAALSFDLLDLDWYDVAPGLLPHLSPPVLTRSTAVGQAELLRSFCTGSDGRTLAGCVP